MKVLLTGGSGFVGSNMVKSLKGTGMNTKCIDLRDDFWKEKLDKSANVIIHLAGKAHDLKKVANIEEYFEVNTALTEELFDCFLSSDCRDFIFFSSIKAVIDHVEIREVNEEMTPNPETPYGQSKRMAEEYILSKSLPPNKRVFILRPAMIHGPGNKGNLNLLYTLVSKGVPWPLGSFENRRSFCSIDNVCFVVKELIERENIPSGVYNLADDEALSTNDLIRLIGSTTRKKARILEIPKGFIKGFAKLGDVLGLPLTTERLEKLTESFVISNRKIKMALGLEELPITAREGLRKTIESFKKNSEEC